MDAGRGGQRHEIVGVRGQDEVVVLGEEHDRSVDHIAAPRPVKQRPGTFAQACIQRHDLDMREQLGQTGLSAGSPAPDLPDHAAVRHRHPSGQAFAFDAGGEFPAAPLDRHERPGVKHHRHAGRGLNRARATVARARRSRAT